jgi:hypothetical protein
MSLCNRTRTHSQEVRKGCRCRRNLNCLQTMKNLAAQISYDFTRKNEPAFFCGRDAGVVGPIGARASP